MDKPGCKTPCGDMIAFTTTVVPLKEIHAEFRGDGIRYQEILLSGRVPGGYGSLRLVLELKSTLSLYSMLERGDAVYEPAGGTASLVCFPDTLSGTAVMELHLSPDLDHPDYSGFSCRQMDGGQYPVP